MQAAIIAAIKAHPPSMDDLESTLAQIKYRGKDMTKFPKAYAAYLERQISKVVRYQLASAITDQVKPEHEGVLTTFNTKQDKLATSFFYVYRLAPNLIKVGLTGNIQQRRHSLQTCREKQIELVGYTEASPGTIKTLEDTWKDKLRGWGLGTSGGTEVFDLTTLGTNATILVQRMLQFSKRPAEVQELSFQQLTDLPVNPTAQQEDSNAENLELQKQINKGKKRLREQEQEHKSYVRMHQPHLDTIGPNSKQFK